LYFMVYYNNLLFNDNIFQSTIGLITTNIINEINSTTIDYVNKKENIKMNIEQFISDDYLPVRYLMESLVTSTLSKELVIKYISYFVNI